ncbi:MAG: chorismate synthase [Rhodospirillaceae bacterium]|nr:chorismate synthase [Rhodospirillaceae bacterium]|tara:strand:+ start:6441 stop:7523 length:1083 start_codon:yes stop_codon:yes gene_type:complete
MSFNTFGHLYRTTTWGESHGPAIGCVVDGCPPNINLEEIDIQKWLDKRKPGQSRFTTQRKEQDKVKILSGVFEGKTTGTPISLLIENMDARSKDYDKIKDKFRPGHADFTYQKKYGHRDYRGGGRQSARETACRVASGAVARKILGSELSIKGAVIQIGDLEINRNNWNENEIDNNPFWCPDIEKVKIWEKYLDEIRMSGSSVGAIIEITARGIPAGLGAPIYKKLDADIASAMMSINAVKAIEIGSGVNASTLKGEENADEIVIKNNKIKFNSNNSGGILGGISSGQDLIVRFTVKPTSSILIETKTVNTKNENDTIKTTGRHDPCVGIRAVPVGEAMLACTLADHFLLHRAQVGELNE